MGFATLSDVHWSMSGEVILMSLLGGVGTFFGPVFGAGIVIALQNLLADKVGAWVTVIIGAIFVVCVLAFRKGVVGELRRLPGAPPAALRLPGRPADRAGRVPGRVIQVIGWRAGLRAKLCDFQQGTP